METEQPTTESPGVSLGLNEDVLGTEAEFFGLNGRESFSPVEQDVVSRTLGGLVLFHGRGVIGGPRKVADDGRPTGRL